ncbi:hypothetical protein F9U64_21485 [Gracilibacillus oryzae]|uniref:Uncharacterized protein n=1 Tax=Gracilibacillus oryzae TaxID=1672701 RepID=A0A7C8GQ86_9BACI|nr:hypothetical protein [Gracilibacillus oryzae]KAB8125829.1 hypothetical protein F9U64_21485 [Gracilibacillus oryzae]
MEDFITLLFLLAVVYFLYKKGIFKNVKFPTVHNNLIMTRDMNSNIKMSYKTFNGMENCLFFMKVSNEYTLNYDIKVTKGSLILKCVKGREVIFEKELTEDEQGSFSFTAENKRYRVLIIGNYTGGGCHVTINPQSNAVVNAPQGRI